MATPSSGQICWSDIQAETGGSYCMDNFNSVSGRGYCAGDYYNYSPTVTVTINWYIPYLMTCYSDYTVTAAASTTLNTSIEVDIYWYGDLGGYAAGTVNMPQNTSCNSTTISTGGGINCWGENISNSTVNIYPSTGTGQSYQAGTYSPIGMSPC